MNGLKVRFALIDEIGNNDVENEIGEGATKKTDGWNGYDSWPIGPFSNPISEVAPGDDSDHESNDHLDHAEQGDAGAVDPTTP